MFIRLLVANEIMDSLPYNAFMCDLRALWRKHASSFGHPSLYAGSTCVHLRLLAGPFDQGLKLCVSTSKLFHVCTSSQNLTYFTALAFFLNFLCLPEFICLMILSHLNSNIAHSIRTSITNSLINEQFRASLMEKISSFVLLMSTL